MKKEELNQIKNKKLAWKGNIFFFSRSYATISQSSTKDFTSAFLNLQLHKLFSCQPKNNQIKTSDKTCNKKDVNVLGK